MYPDNLRYSEDHEWVKVDGDHGIVGITQHAQEALGDIVFVELPEVGDEVEQGDTAGSIESVKAVSDIFSPVSGEITEVNDALEDAPETVNSSPYDDGWLFRIKISEPAQLDAMMDSKSYQEFLKESD